LSGNPLELLTIFKGGGGAVGCVYDYLACALKKSRVYSDKVFNKHGRILDMSKKKPDERRNDPFGYGLEAYTDRQNGLYPCIECHISTRGRHHIVPVSRGGKRQVPLCDRCHKLAHGITGAELSPLIKEGLAKARERGVVLGAPARIPDMDEAIWEMRKSGKSIREIAKAFGISTGSAHNAIKRLRELEELDKE